MASADRRRGLPLAAVAALHLMVLGALLQAGVWRDRVRPPASKPPLEVTLLLPPAVVAPAPAARAPLSAAPPPRLRPSPRPVPALEVPAAAALPADPVGSPVTAPSAPAPVVEAPASAAGPLRLELPRATIRRNAALDDPRANTTRPTLEAQIAAALGGEGPWTEEHVGEGVVRFRRGRSCVEAHETRDVGLDPFNQSVTHKPRLARNC